MSGKQLSVIIPVYNVEKYIAKCLRSIVEEGAQALEAVEVIVVDDGSTDKSGRIADAFARKHPCVRVIHQENAGVAAARNAGIRSACGAWLYFADSDDWLEKGGVRAICEETAKVPDADVLFMEAYQDVGRKQSGWVHFDADTDMADRESITKLQCGVLYAPLWRRTKNDPMAAPWDKVYRRDFLMENHLQFCAHLKVLDDMVFNFEVMGAARNVACRKIRPYHYRRFVAESITNTYKPDRVLQDREVWRYLLSLDAWGGNDVLQKALMCRIVKSFSICCRLCFFHADHRRSLREKIRYVERVMGSEPYRTAFGTVRLSDLEWKLKIVALAGRIRSGWAMYLLHVAWESAKKLKNLRG